MKESIGAGGVEIASFGPAGPAHLQIKCTTRCLIYFCFVCKSQYVIAFSCHNSQDWKLFLYFVVIFLLYFVLYMGISGTIFVAIFALFSEHLLIYPTNLLIIFLLI
jgi:hypothetical protein